MTFFFRAVAPWLLLASTLEAGVIRVPLDHARITDALLAASPGDTVSVAAGTYSSGTNGESFPLYIIDSDLCLLGAGPSACTLDAGGSGSVVIAAADSAGRISGFTITGGSAHSGGGIRVAEGYPEIDHNVLLGNAAQWSGSGIHIENYRSANIHHNVLWENHDVNVGADGDPHGIQFGLYAQGFVEHNLVGRGDSNGLLNTTGSAPTVRNNIFFENGIPGLRGRGICHLGDSTAVFSHNLFHGNVIAAFLIKGTPSVNVSGAGANGLSATDAIYGNLDGDPIFVNAEGSDWQLAWPSPAIDAGDPVTPLDPDGTTADLGPFFRNQEAGAAPDPFVEPIARLLAFPNPTRAGTTVLFEVRSEGHVVVRVFDVVGREVALLHDARREPGTHAIVWDGRDVGGKEAVPGIYFLRLATEEGDVVRKVTLLP